MVVTLHNDVVISYRLYYVNGRDMVEMGSSKAKIKICHFITKMVYGGASIGTLRLAQDMDHSVFKSTIVCGCQSSDEGNLLKDTGEKRFEAVVMPEIVREINPIKDIRAFIKVVRFLKSGTFDIVHAHGSRAGVISRLAAAVCKVPVVLYTVHGWSLKAGFSLTALLMRVERVLALITDKILFQTRSDLDEAKQYRIGRADQYVLIGNGVALDEFFRVHPKRILDKRKELRIGSHKVVGTVGRVSAQKNPVGFVNIAKEVLSNRTDVIFLFVGGGELLEKVQNIVRELGLGDRIVFTGFRRDIPEIMANFDIFILPSLWEGMPRSVIEAMALSKPVVVHGIGGIDEVVEHSKNGYIVPIGHTADFAAKVGLLLDDNRMRRRMGKAGKNKARTYDFNNIVHKTAELYKKLSQETGVKVA